MIWYVIAGITAIFFAALIIYREGARVEFSYYTLPLHDLPIELEKLKIAHITDIHYPFHMKRDALDRVITLVNEEQPDIIVITGDLVTRRSPERWECPRLLGNLTARYGIFAVLGNHDYCFGRRELQEILEDSGITVLRNEHRYTGPGGASLQILGLDDPSTFRDDAEALFQGLKSGGLRILITHSPAGIRAALDKSVPLIFVGHTHGGQVRIPFFGAAYLPTRAMREFDRGWFFRSGSSIFVNSGLGFAGIPIRFLCPREVAFVTLTSSGSKMSKKRKTVSG